MEELQKLVLKILNPLLEEHKLFLVDLKINDSNGSVRVFIDMVPGITIDECVLVSRVLEKELNEVFNFSDKYSLEVSSPGLEAPFKVKEQYEQYIGRPVEVICDDGSKLTGKIGAVEGEKLTLLVEKPKKSNKKQMEEEPKELEFSHIKSTKPYIKF